MAGGEIKKLCRSKLGQYNLLVNAENLAIELVSQKKLTVQ